jgi:hypothetical protein
MYKLTQSESISFKKSNQSDSVSFNKIKLIQSDSSKSKPNPSRKKFTSNHITMESRPIAATICIVLFNGGVQKLREFVVDRGGNRVGSIYMCFFRSLIDFN